MYLEGEEEEEEEEEEEDFLEWVIRAEIHLKKYQVGYISNIVTCRWMQKENC